jgi:hypothetical protein
MKSFLIQPETNNSITLWVRDYPLHLMADNRDLLLSFDIDEFEATVVNNGVRIKRIRKHDPVTIEQMSGSIDFEKCETVEP